MPEATVTTAPEHVSPRPHQAPCPGPWPPRLLSRARPPCTPAPRPGRSGQRSGPHLWRAPWASGKDPPGKGAPPTAGFWGPWCRRLDKRGHERRAAGSPRPGKPESPEGKALGSGGEVGGTVASEEP